MNVKNIMNDVMNDGKYIQKRGGTYDIPGYSQAIIDASNADDNVSK